MTDPIALAERAIEAASIAATEATFSFDATNWADEDVRAFIEYARTLCDGKTIRLKGVRVGADVFMRLGGAQGGFVNARVQGGVPLVQVSESDSVELVFGP